MAEAVIHKTSLSSFTILAASAGILVVIDILFIFLIGSNAKSITLLRKELTQLEAEAQIISSAADIESTYKNEIALISQVFPDDQTIPQFVSTVEDLSKQMSDSYSLKFTSDVPLKEQDKLILPFTLTLKTDMDRLLVFLQTLEKLPYMTHITKIAAKAPDGFTQLQDIQISFKVYVQNPFTTK